MLPVSYLFVPATRCERMGKAWAAGAQAVIVDLEDAVDPAHKDAARDQVAQALPAGTQPVWLRINGLSSPGLLKIWPWCKRWRPANAWPG
jgi:citrate lyase subunit beta/citryl-CoA lyase